MAPSSVTHRFVVGRAVGSLPFLHTSRRRATLRSRVSRWIEAETVVSSKNSGGWIQPELDKRRKTSSVASAGQDGEVGIPLMACRAPSEL